MAKSKRVKWIVIGILSGVGTVVLIAAFGFLIYLTTFHCDWGRVYNHYAEDVGDYYKLEVTVGEIKYFEQYNEGSLYIKAPYEQHFVICESTYQMLMESDFFDVVGEGSIITIYSHPYIAWDGWTCPIVGIHVGDRVYVDFDTGKQNWLDTLKQRSEGSFLQTPIKQ
ncbi:MAG: hypothetical protein J1G02_01295 [Clostridiales bacterium]|nr:hypothetical protein [Clostridiales bacterium]